MKNSGVEWIGEIPDGWEVKKLKYICDPLASGGTPDSNNDQYYCENGTNWVAINDMSLVDYVENTAKHITNLAINEKKLKIYPKGTIIYSIYATLGHVAELSKPACINQALLALSIKDKSFNKSYFKYSLNAMKEYVLAFSSGNTQFNLNAQKVRNFTLLTPSFETQQRIASYLDKKCNKIEETIQNQQQVIEKLKAYKQSLITEAVTGKIKIQNGKACGKNESYKDSGVEWIGKIPSEWEVGKTGMFTYVTKLAGFEFTDIMMDKISEIGDVPIVRAQNVRMFKFNKEIINEYIDLSTSNTLNRCCLDKKCLLITFIGAGIGDVCIFNESIRYHLAPNVAKIEIRNFSKTKLCEEFLMYYIGSEPGKREIANISKAAAQPSLSMETIRKIKLCIPPFEEQKEIANYLEKKCTVIDTSIEQKQNLIEKLTEYKKSLIYECVTGKKAI